eukprot:NODE_102_length_19640_cov_1.308735.p9 type:complete len:360 gc:universal NODE_102_length_19640_cov_1.308735:15026-16105(+)
MTNSEILHSNFPTEREVNPTKFDHLMSEWREVLNNYFDQHQKKLVFDCNNIRNDLNYPGLYTALDDFLGRQVLIHSYQLPYFCDSFWKFFRFVFCKAYIAEYRKDHLEGNLIHIERIRSLEKEIKMKAGFDRSSKLFLLAEFNQFISKYTNDVDFFIRYLHANKSINIKGNLIKFGSEPIINADTQILTVKTTLSTLNRHVEKLEHDILNITDLILQNKTNKSKALTLLKKKKQYHILLQQKFTTIETLENILLKIDNCETEKQIMDAYQNGSSVIKNTMKEYGLTVENVQNAVELAQDTIMDSEEIQQALPSVEIDEDIEREFAQILKDFELKPSLPAVPTEIIESSYNDQIKNLVPQ